jgi:hypothetical protein
MIYIPHIEDLDGHYEWIIAASPSGVINTPQLVVNILFAMLLIVLAVNVSRHVWKIIGVSAIIISACAGATIGIWALNERQRYAETDAVSRAEADEDFAVTLRRQLDEADNAETRHRLFSESKRFWRNAADNWHIAGQYDAEHWAREAEKKLQVPPPRPQRKDESSPNFFDQFDFPDGTRTLDAVKRAKKGDIFDQLDATPTPFTPPSLNSLEPVDPYAEFADPVTPTPPNSP